MTDTVKINIQQEVAVLQNKVKFLEDENNRLLSDLEAMNQERLNLLKVKDEYFAMIERQVTIQQKIDVSDLKASFTIRLKRRIRYFFVCSLGYPKYGSQPNQEGIT